MPSGCKRVGRRRAGLLLGLLLGLLWASSGAVGDDGLPPALSALVEELATCNAYFFNAANAAPMRDYEALYGAGERARNRALRYLDPADFDRLVGDASTVMTSMTGGDWRQFGRVQARYGAACDALDESLHRGE